MDFLKKNGFAVGLGALGLLAAVLLYLLVMQKIWGGLTDSRTALGEINKEFGKYTRMTPVPSEKSKAAVEVAQKKWDEAIAEGTKFYDSRKEKFEELHDEYSSGGRTADDAPSFKTFYETMVKKLREDYQAAFKPKEAAAASPASAGAAPAPAATPAPAAPAVDPSKQPPIILAYPKFNNADDVKRAMKELWIVIDVFKALTDLKIGGLQEIFFPERDKSAVIEPGAMYNWLRSRVTVEMPFIQVEPFLAKLFESDRVPFRLDSLTVKRKQETVIVKMVVDRPVDEPTVEVTFELSALNWIGVPAPAPPPAEKK